MDDFVRAAGFKELTAQKRKLTSVVKKASECTDARRKLVVSLDSMNIECYRYCGKKFGLTTYNRKNNADEIKLKRWEVFAESKQNTLCNDIYVERGTDGQLYAFCEDEDTGSEFEFRLNNIVDFKKNGIDCLISCGPIAVNVAGLASYGTIILPVKKNETARETRKYEDMEHKELLNRARKGDEDAEAIMNERAYQMAQSVRERLKTEDLLSVFEGYLLPVGDEDGIFAILGDIIAIEKDCNELTGENILVLSLYITGAFLTVYVNESDVLGMPIEGMRFMGVCKLQGSIVFND